MSGKHSHIICLWPMGSKTEHLPICRDTQERHQVWGIFPSNSLRYFSYYFISCYLNILSFNFLYLIRFLMWTFFKVFIEFVTIGLLFYAFFFYLKACGILAYSIRDGTHTPGIGRKRLNYWTAREVPLFVCYTDLQFPKIGGQIHFGSQNFSDFKNIAHILCKTHPL